MPTIGPFQSITSQLHCPDRVIFHGHLMRLCLPSGPLHLVKLLGLMLAQVVTWLGVWRAQLIQHAHAEARRRGRPVLRLKSGDRQEDAVQRVLRQQPVRRGLVCVVQTQEPFASFRFFGKKETPAFRPERRWGTTLYYYYLDPDFGLLHVRVDSYLPYTAQVYINGHSWLARQMRRARIRFTQQDNVFTWIQAPQPAQALADRFARQNWTVFLDGLIRKVNPLLTGVLRGERYYWCVDQFEFATDLLFPQPPTLQPLWARLRQAAMTGLTGEQILAFFGRQPQNGSWEVVNDIQRRYRGFRLKHRLGRNWIKCYDKAGSVLRIETTINDARAFQMYRHDLQRWSAVRKSVADLYHIVQIARRANLRYLKALTALEALPAQGQELLRLQLPHLRQGRRIPGLRFLSDGCLALFQAVTAGEVHLRGLTNAQLRRTLFGAPHRDPREERRRAQRLTRQLARLRDHGLIRKLPHTRRWAPTAKGQRLMHQAIELRNSLWPNALPLAA